MGDVGVDGRCCDLLVISGFVELPHFRSDEEFNQLTTGFFQQFEFQHDGEQLHEEDPAASLSDENTDHKLLTHIKNQIITPRKLFY